MRFVITGGGTGGHLAIARALHDAINQSGDEAIFIGSTSGQDRQWFADDPGFKAAHFLPTTGVVNRRGAAKLLAVFKAASGIRRARRILKTYGADAVISVGGFSAAPASIAALLMGIPLFIHEQNAVMGRLNRLLKPYARICFSSYDPKSPVKGYPVNTALFETARVRTAVKSIIFLGGSQGAKAINDFALQHAGMLVARDIRIIHQCGDRDFDRVAAAYRKQGVDAELYGFTKELPALLQHSDLAVSRAGASTLWELAANGLPALYVPYPYAAGDHQFYNAAYLVKQGASWMVRESELDTAQLERVLGGDIEAASRTLLRLAEPEAANEILDAIKERC